MPVYRIRDVYPGSRLLTFIPDRVVPDLTTATKFEGEKICCPSFFLKPQISQNLKLFYIWTGEEKKFKRLCQFTKNYSTFYPKKMSKSFKKYGFGIRDPGFGWNLFRLPDPGVKKAPDPGFATKRYHCRGSVPLSFHGWPSCAWKICELGCKFKKVIAGSKIFPSSDLFDFGLGWRWK